MDQKFSDAYRTKLRNRLKTAQQRVSQKSSLEESLRTQESQLKRDIETRLSSRSELKRNIGQELNTEFKEDVVSKEESFDFFFKTDINIEKSEIKTEPKTESNTGRSGEQVIQIEETNPRDSRLLINDMFSSATNWNLCERNKSILIPFKDRIKEENKVLFIPSDKVSEESDESILKKEVNQYQNMNELLSLKNMNKIKSRLISEGLKDKFLDQNSEFLGNNHKIEVKNSILFDPNFGSDIELIARHKPNKSSLKEVVNNLFKKSDDFLTDGRTAQNNRNERRVLANIETLNLDQLNQLVQQLRLQDSLQNNSLIHSIESHLKTIDSSQPTVGESDNQSSKDLEFCSEEELDNNRRFKLLRFRWEGVTPFKNYRFVPLNEKEIPSDLFEEKQKFQNPLHTKRVFEAIERREKAIELLTKVGEQLIKQSSGTVDRPRTLEDMVVEEDIPGIRFDLT